MQKTIFPLLVLLCLSITARATNVSGLITSNTTWTKANSPYVVTGNTVIDTGATLIIEPGVKVLFDVGYFFHVKGMIMADGTSADSIIFTSNSATPKMNDWEGINVWYQNLTDTIIFNYCRVEYAHIALLIGSNPARITNCTFGHNGIAVQNATVSGSYLYVYNCRFEHCYHAMRIAGSVDATNNIIISNHYGLEITGSGYHYFADNMLAYNAYGIKGWGIFYNNIIVHSSIAGISGGGEVTYNQLWYNKIGVIHRDQHGNLKHNGIKYNGIGIQSEYASKVEDTTIRYNCIEHSVDKEYENKTAYPTNVSFNYWGTTDSTILADKITDFYDNLTSGKTIFLPALHMPDSGCKDSLNIPVLPPTVISKVESVTSVNIFPNPVGNTISVEVQQPHSLQSIQMYNLTGQQVANLQINASKTTIDATTLPQGLYLYKVLLDNNEVVIGKFLKE